MGISTHHLKERKSLARHARRGRKAMRLQRSLRSLRRNRLSPCCVRVAWELGKRNGEAESFPLVSAAQEVARSTATLAARGAFPF